MFPAKVPVVELVNDPALTAPVALIELVTVKAFSVLVPPPAVTVDPYNPPDEFTDAAPIAVVAVNDETDTAPVADNVEHVTALKLALPVTVRFPSEPTFVIWD